MLEQILTGIKLVVKTTLLKITKGTNIAHGTPGLPYKLYFLHSICD